MSKIIHGLVSALKTVHSAAVVAAALKAHHRPAKADLRRLGINEADFAAFGY